MKLLRNIWNFFFCRHTYVFVRNIYGDEIVHSGKFKRSWWQCSKCGKWDSSPVLVDEKDN